MDAQPERNRPETRLAPDGLIPALEPTENGSEWIGRVEWGPGQMHNDLGPATVIVTREDLEREAAAIVVQRAVERAIERGEESEYDE